jgi:hypothetical protein
MNLKHASQRASIVPGPKSAARLYNEIEYELALGEPDGDLERAGEQALQLLEDRFPGVRDAAREIDEPPSLSRRASAALHGIGPTTPQSRPATPCRTRPRRASRSSHGLYAYARAHPWPAAAMVAFSIVVIVHFLAYIVLGAIALTAIKAWGARR